MRECVCVCMFLDSLEWKKCVLYIPTTVAVCTVLGCLSAVLTCIHVIQAEDV